MRLFVALPFPPEVKKALVLTMESLKKSAKSGNFTRVENLHLTLAFIGENQRIDAAKDALSSIRGKHFTAKISGMGHFGDLYWAGIRENPALTALAAQVQDALRTRGFPIEQRAFQPHITLARQVRAAGPLHLAAPEELDFPVTRLCLMRSDRVQGRLVYREIFAQELD